MTADDVLLVVTRKLNHLLWIGFGGCVLILAVFGATLYVYGRVIQVLRANKLALKLIFDQGLISDAQHDRTDRTLTKADRTLGDVKTVLVDHVPKKVAEAAKEAMREVVEETSGKIDLPPGWKPPKPTG